jgi:hypothetical protein
MTHRRLTCSGWLAMTSAVLTIPWFVLTFVLAGQGGVWPKVTQGVLLTAGTTLLVYLLVTFKRLLHENFTFHAVDRVIALLVKVNIVSAAVSLLGLAVPPLESALGVVGIVLAVAGGIAQIMFGVKLLRLPGNLGGLHKPYGYLNIVTGFCLATVVLLPLGMVTSAVADVMLGTIFFQVAGRSGA